MSEQIHRVTRCGACYAIYPHVRSHCSDCGSRERIGSTASAEEVERVRLLHGVARSAVVLPRHAPVRPAAGSSWWSRALAWRTAHVPQLLGVLRRR